MMCGRYLFTISISEMIKIIKEKWHQEVIYESEINKDYNIAPSKKAPILYHSNKSLLLQDMTWGLKPPWKNNGQLVINARIETIKNKPMFKDAYQSRRCLVLSSGFYEWHHQTKQPYLFTFTNRPYIAFAGIWNKDHVDGTNHYAILTTPSNGTLSNIHHRMPLILDQSVERDWIMGENPDKIIQRQRVKEMLLTRKAVSTYVNSVSNNGPRCIESGREQMSFFIE